MVPKITFQVVQGEVPEKTLVFSNRTFGTLGRGHDCFLQIPNGPSFLDISRHHCLLDIDPPQVRVRDLGSRNGTFVNGESIGHREKNQSPEEAQVNELPEHALKDGDEIKVGQVIFKVQILGDQAQ